MPGLSKGIFSEKEKRMKTYNIGAQSIPPEAKGAVVVIGNFDGVHKGHQVLLNRAKECAASLGKPLAVLTFEPHPRELFRPDEPPCRITPKSLKAERLKKEGVGHLFYKTFDWDFASLSAQGFIDTVLQKELAAGHVIVGFDFRFGQMRSGTPKMIESAGIPVTVIEEIKQEKGDEISSSRIRQHLRRGEIGAANALLGWEWEVRGEIVRGDRRGRELGYPTANMALGETLHPAYGVYAAFARLEGEEQWHPAAVNIGIRPMFKVPTAQVETFIFDFDREIYGQTLHVRPVTRLRSEAKFANVQDLIVQMEKDCAQARDILNVRK